MITRVRSAGFTLIELLVTLAIVALLASAALPLAEVTVQRGKEQELRRALREIREGLDRYRHAVEEGRIERASGASGYPAKLSTLVEGIRDARHPGGARLYFLRRIPRDPFARDPGLPPEQTWGLRSHASPPDNPQPGEDVFDVYSLSGATGLNGIPYREW